MGLYLLFLAVGYHQNIPTKQIQSNKRLDSSLKWPVIWWEKLNTYLKRYKFKIVQGEFKKKKKGILQKFKDRKTFESWNNLETQLRGGIGTKTSRIRLAEMHARHSRHPGQGQHHEPREEGMTLCTEGFCVNLYD